MIDYVNVFSFQAMDLCLENLGEALPLLMRFICEILWNLQMF